MNCYSNITQEDSFNHYPSTVFIFVFVNHMYFIYFLSFKPITGGDVCLLNMPPPQRMSLAPTVTLPNTPACGRARPCAPAGWVFPFLSRPVLEVSCSRTEWENRRITYGTGQPTARRLPGTYQLLSYSHTWTQSHTTNTKLNPSHCQVAMLLHFDQHFILHLALCVTCLYCNTAKLWMFWCTLKLNSECQN